MQLMFGRNAHVPPPPPPPLIPIPGLREFIRKNPAGKALTYKEDTSTSQKRLALHGATAGGAGRAEWNAYSTSIQTHFVTDIPFISKIAGAANKVPFIARGVLIEPVGHLAYAGDARDMPTRTLSALAYVALTVDAADAATGMNRVSALHSNYFGEDELSTTFDIDISADVDIDLAEFVHEGGNNALIFVDATNQDELLPRFPETEARARDWINNGNVPARAAPALINANPLGVPVPPAAGVNRPRDDLVDLVHQPPQDGHVTTAQLFHLLMSQNSTSQGKSDSEDQKRLTTHLVRFMDPDFVRAIGGDQLNPKNILFIANNQIKERIAIYFSHTVVTITPTQIKNIFLLHLKEFFQSSAAVEAFVKCLNPFSAKAFNDYFTLLIDVLSLFMSREFVTLLQGVNDDLNRFLNRQQNARSFELEITQYFINELEVRLCLPKIFPTTLSLLESKTIHNAIGIPLEVPSLSFTHGSQLCNMLLAHVQRLDRDRVGNTISKLEARLSAQTVSDRPQATTTNSRRSHDNHQTGYGQRYPSSNDRGRGTHTGGRNARDRSRDDNRDIRPMSLDDICLSMMVGRQCTFTNCRRLHVPVPPNLQHLVQQYIRAPPPRAALAPPPPPQDNRALQRYVPAEHRAPPRGRG